MQFIIIKVQDINLATRKAWFGHSHSFLVPFIFVLIFHAMKCSFSRWYFQRSSTERNVFGKLKVNLRFSAGAKQKINHHKSARLASVKHISRGSLLLLPRVEKAKMKTRGGYFLEYKHSHGNRIFLVWFQFIANFIAIICNAREWKMRMASF